MRYLYLLLLSLAALSARAQQPWQPFRLGRTYQLSRSATPGDTTHLLRLMSGQRVGADSVFLFNARTSRTSVQGGCGSYVRRAANLFGATMARVGSTYVFYNTSRGTRFTLRPTQPVGQPWAATAAGVMGQVTSRTLGTVLGQPDSLVTISITGGGVIVLSKRFGWVSGPALGRYLSPRLPNTPLLLTALPELGLGNAIMGPLAVFDFQPGDVFLRRTFSPSAVFGCFTQWTRDSILSRTVSPGGAGITYQYRSRTLVKGCQPVVFTLNPPTTLTQYVTPQTSVMFLDPVANAGTNLTGYWEATSSSPSSAVGPLHLPSWRTADYNGRPVQGHIVLLNCRAAPADSLLMDAGNLDNGYHAGSAPGLGLVFTSVISFTGETMQLIGYRKGTETWGQLTTFAQLLAARDVRPAASTTAFPNPFASTLTATFALARPQAVAAELRDALGRTVRQVPGAAFAAGAGRLEVPTAGLPAGVYTLHLHFAGEKRHEVLKVVKAD